MVSAKPDFSTAAPFYSGRIPYFPQFFSELTSAAALTDKSLALDLACGTGELAVGLAPYCGEVVGIDKSPEMLSSRRGVPQNVRFVRADLNKDTVTVDRRPAIVTIGRAIPYLDKAALLPFLASMEVESVFICGAGLSPNVPWLPQYATLCGQYREREVASGYDGQAFFSNSRWTAGRRIAVTGTVRCRLEHILQFSLSYSSLMKRILDDNERFSSELNRILAPYHDRSGLLTFETVSWGVEYRTHPVRP